MIKVQTHKNLIFFFSILAKVDPKKKYHPLGKILMEELNYDSIEAFNKFENYYNKKEIPTHPYKYSIYSINTKKDLSTKTINSESGFGENTITTYKNKIEKHIKQIYEFSNFEEIYNKLIFKKYLNVTKQIQNNFKGTVEDSIEKVWGIEKKYVFILIPNILEVEHSFGVFRKNKLYSITSPTNKKNAICFRPQFVISNAIHEFSHSIFQKFLIENDLYNKHKELTKNFTIPKKLTNIHSNPSIYLEETFIKTMTLLTQEILYKNHMSRKILKLKSEEKLHRLEEQGYYKSRELYSILKNSKDKKRIYLDYLSENI